jgi:hypothetical protein
MEGYSMSVDSKPHSVPQDVEEAFSVLEKRLHPTWEIEGVQATAILRHHYESLFEQLETLRAAAGEMIDFLWHEKETFEPPSDLLDKGYAALETSKDYDREEQLADKLGAALGRDIATDAYPASEPL